MSLSTRLDNFRSDNPFDVATQAKRLLATKDDKLILYVLELGLALAKQRQQHEARQYIKETGYAQSTEKLVIRPGRVTGSVIIKPSKKTQNAMQQLILDTWTINEGQKLGDATWADLEKAKKRDLLSAEGLKKNHSLYTNLQKPLDIKSRDNVRTHWSDEDKKLRPLIESVYGEFRRNAA